MTAPAGTGETTVAAEEDARDALDPRPPPTGAVRRVEEAAAERSAGKPDRTDSLPPVTRTAVGADDPASRSDERPDPSEGLRSRGEHEEGKADRLRVLALLSLALSAVSPSILFALGVPSDQPTAGAVSLVPGVGLSVYLARQSAQHRKSSREHLDDAVRLKALADAGGLMPDGAWRAAWEDWGRGLFPPSAPERDRSSTPVGRLPMRGRRWVRERD